MPKEIPTAKKSTICPALNKRIKKKVKSSSTTITKSKSQSKDLSTVSSQASTTSTNTTNTGTNTAATGVGGVKSTPSTNSKYRKKRSVSYHTDEVKAKGLVRGNRIRKKGGQRVLSKGSNNCLPPPNKPTTPTQSSSSNNNNKPTTPTLPSVIPPRPLSSNSSNSKLLNYNSQLVANLPDNVSGSDNDYNFINTRKTHTRSRSSSSNSDKEYKDGNESKLSESKLNEDDEGTLPSESTMILHNSTTISVIDEESKTCESLLKDELKKTNLTTITEEKSTPSDTMSSTEKTVNENTIIINNDNKEVLNESKLDTVIIKGQEPLSINTKSNTVVLDDDIIIDSVSKPNNNNNNILDDSNPLISQSSNEIDYKSIIDDSYSHLTSNNQSALPSADDSDTFEDNVSNEYKSNNNTIKSQLKQVHSEIIGGGIGNNVNRSSSNENDSEIDDDDEIDDNEDEEDDDFDDLDSRQEEKSFEYDDDESYYDENIKQNNYRNIKEGVEITTTPKNVKEFSEEKKDENYLIHTDKNGVEFSIEPSNIKASKSKSSYLHNRNSTPGLSDDEEYESDESNDYKSHGFYNEGDEICIYILYLYYI